MHSELAKKQNVRTIVPKIRPSNVAICFSHRCSESPPGFRSVRGVQKKPPLALRPIQYQQDDHNRQDQAPPAV